MRHPGAGRDRRSRPLSILWYAATLALLTGACSTAGGADPVGDSDDGLSIMATTTIMGDVVRTVAPDTAEVVVLMEAGTDPHTFEPSARQLAQMQEADLLVTNGGGLEEGLRSALEDAEAAGVTVFSAVDHITPLEGDDHDDHGHDHGGIDPHFWMDPVRMAGAVRVLGAQIGQLTGTPQRSANRAHRYVAELRDLDHRIDRRLDDIDDDRRTMVTNHEALGYFADRYHLRIVGTVIPSMTTGAEPSARDIEQLAEVLRREDIAVIFVDSTAPRRLAETLAREVGPETRIVELFTESIGGDGDAPGSYVDMLMLDAERIDTALRG